MVYLYSVENVISLVGLLLLFCPHLSILFLKLQKYKERACSLCNGNHFSVYEYEIFLIMAEVELKFLPLLRISQDVEVTF